MPAIGACRMGSSIPGKALDDVMTIPSTPQLRGRGVAAIALCCFDEMLEKPPSTATKDGR
jgi:hypothetical protein